MKQRLFPSTTLLLLLLLLQSVGSVPSHAAAANPQTQEAATQEAATQEAAGGAAGGGRIDWTELPPAAAGGVWLFSGPELKHWRVADQSYFDKHGPVTWQDDVLTLPAGSPGTGVVADFSVPRNNYEIHFQARRTAGDDFFGGLTFPFDDQQATLILGGWGGGTVGISNVNQFSAIENASTRNFAFENDRWYDFRLRVTPEEIELWVDQKSLFLLDTEEKTFSIWWEQRPMAPLGFASWRTTGQFRRVRLMATASSEAPSLPRTNQTPESRSAALDNGR